MERFPGRQIVDLKRLRWSDARAPISHIEFIILLNQTTEMSPCTNIYPLRGFDFCQKSSAAIA